LVAAGLLAGFLVDSQFASAADDSSKDQSSVKAASYTTGKIGSRLKWTSQRGEPRHDDPAVKPTQCVTPEAADEPSCGVRAAQELQPSSEAWSKSVPKKDVSPAPDVNSEKDLPPIPNSKSNAPTNPLLVKELNPQQQSLKPGCPSPKDLKRIKDRNTSLTPSEGELPPECPLGNDVFQTRSFAPITYTWTASQLCHKPLYFEDEQLERYGHMAGPWLQPFASAANFFCTIPILPYKMGLELPNECIYTLGYYRPGSCAPYLFDPLPISVRGLFYEGGAWVGACALFP
jgi:hypothetical protein